MCIGIIIKHSISLDNFECTFINEYDASVQNVVGTQYNNSFMLVTIFSGSYLIFYAHIM